MSDTTGQESRPDTLNEIGVLKRREIEARIVAPLLERLGEEFGREEVMRVARDVVVGVAAEQGAALADAAGGNDLVSFAGTLDAWTKGDALEIDVIEQSPDRYAFNVTRCGYAEMYKALGIPELGAMLSCERDGSLMDGFNADIEFSRSQTIMGGASHCDFLYQIGPKSPSGGDD